MKYYKLINGRGYSTYKEGIIYKEDYLHYSLKAPTNRVNCWVKEEPYNWQLCEEYEYYLQEGLPEKWYIKTTSESNTLVCDWYDNLDHKTDRTVGNFYCTDNGITQGWMYYAPERTVGYTEISFDTFKRLVLKQNDMKDKEIIGYKLKEDYEKYRSAAEKIADYKPCSSPLEFYLEKSQWGSFKQNLEKAGVLNLWFDAVYAEEYKVGDWVVVKYTGQHVMGFTGNGEKVLQISYYKNEPYYWPQKGYEKQVDSNKYYIGFNDNTITFTANSPLDFIVRKATSEEVKAAQYPQIEVNGYKGEFLEDRVKFGCASISKDTFIGLSKLLGGNPRSNKTIMKVTIGQGDFTKDQIKLIAEYYLNK